MKKIAYFWRRGIWNLFNLCFLGFIVVGIAYVYLDSKLPDIDTLKNVQLQVPLQIYTKDGLLIQEYGEKRRIPVQYADIPKPLIQAIIVTEDRRFFEHPGIDIYGLMRATVSMIHTRSKSQGGSTITMQVARNFFLNRKKTFLRKFHEIILAIKIDRELPKEKILELYCNKIYLGNRAYGVGAAAQIYYGKELKDLSLAEMAMIAGLPQAPSVHNPIANPKAAKKRRDHVLMRLLEAKFITQADYAKAIEEPIKSTYHGARIEVEAPYVAEMIRQAMITHFGDAIYTQGYKVYTTIESPLQMAANTALHNGLIDYHHRHPRRAMPQGALVALDPNDGALKALVGGYDFSKNKFNRATQSLRQPGSSFKPFIYAAALDKGYTWSTIVNDAPIALYDPSQPNLWRPHNDTLTFEGPMRLKEALVHSRNLVSIRVLDDIGLDYAIDYLGRFGFAKNTLPKGLSLALGSLSISPLDLTRAYAVFANGGFYVEPYVIDKVVDHHDKVVLQAKPIFVCRTQTCPNAHGVPAKRVLSEDTTFLVNTGLQAVVQRGTAAAARVLNRNDIAGKTGTSNEQADAWFAGFNPSIVTSVWVGYDEPHSLHEYGANLALPIWIGFMKSALEHTKDVSWKQPASVITARIDANTGLRLPEGQDTDGVVEYFHKDHVPEIDEGNTEVQVVDARPEMRVEEDLF
jgi:penicillin-binding protein 1A